MDIREEIEEWFPNIISNPFRISGDSEYAYGDVDLILRKKC